MIPLGSKQKREQEIHQHKIGREYIKLAADEHRKNELHDVKLADAIRKFHVGDASDRMKLEQQANEAGMSAERKNQEHKAKMTEKFGQGTYDVQGYHHGGTAEKKVLGELNARMAQHPPVPQGYFAGSDEIPMVDGYMCGTKHVKGYEEGTKIVVPTSTRVPSATMNWGFAGGIPNTPAHPMTGTAPINPEAGPGDTVPAMLTPGEAVIPREAAQHPKYKKQIKQMINHGRQMQDAKKYGHGTKAAGYSEGVYNVPGYESGILSAGTSEGVQEVLDQQNQPGVVPVPFTPATSSPAVPPANPVTAAINTVANSPVEQVTNAQNAQKVSSYEGDGDVPSMMTPESQPDLYRFGQVPPPDSQTVFYPRADRPAVFRPEVTQQDIASMEPPADGVYGKDTNLNKATAYDILTPTGTGEIPPMSADYQTQLRKAESEIVAHAGGDTQKDPESFGHMIGSALSKVGDFLGYDSKDIARFATIALGSRALGYNDTQAIRYAFKQMDTQAQQRAAHREAEASAMKKLEYQRDTELAKQKMHDTAMLQGYGFRSGQQQQQQQRSLLLEQVKANDKAGVYAPGVAERLQSAIVNNNQNEVAAIHADSRNFSPVAIQAKGLGIDLSKDPEKRVGIVTDPQSKTTSSYGTVDELYRGRDGSYYRRLPTGALEKVSYETRPASEADTLEGQRKSVKEGLDKTYFEPQRNAQGKVVAEPPFSQAKYDDAVNSVVKFAQRNNLNAGELTMRMKPVLDMAAKSGDKSPDFEAYLEFTHLGGDKLVAQDRLMNQSGKMMNSNEVREVNKELSGVKKNAADRAEYLSRVEAAYKANLPMASYTDKIPQILEKTGLKASEADIKAARERIASAPNTYVANLYLQGFLERLRDKK